MFSLLWPVEHPIWFVVLAVLTVIPVWRICTRMGHPGWFSIAVLVPIVNILFLYFLAFTDWPRERAPTSPVRE